MIGGLSSSLALAQRTASSARKTMDTMSRQIATGQKVASVKDDGAAWTRANLAKGNAAAREVVADNQDYTRAGVSWARQSEHRIELATRASELATLATVPGTSASTVVALQAEYNEIRGTFNANSYGQFGTELLLNRADGTGAWVPFSVSSMAHTNLAWIDGIDGSTSQWGRSTLATAGTANAVTVSISTPASAAAAKAVWDSVANDFRAIIADIGSLETRLERSSETHRDMAGRELALSGSLTDADLGKVSAARAQADTRQQLALQTIQQALSAYGNYAGSLLGNVQRTQQGVRA